MNKNLIKAFLIVFVALIVSSCKPYNCPPQCAEGDELCYKFCPKDQCVEADDWGDPRIFIPASSEGPIDSKQKIMNAEEIPIVITIGQNDQWTSWVTSNDKPQTPNIECTYIVTNGSSPGELIDDISPATVYADKDDTSKLFYYDDKKTDGERYVPIQGYSTAPSSLEYNSRAPCYYRYGMGLYMGLANDDGSGVVSPDDVVISYHIPDMKSPDAVGNVTDESSDYRNSRAIDGYLARGLPSNEIPGAQTNDRLYFKIVDSHYEDNSGGYTVRFKEGTRNAESGPLETITNMIIQPALLIMERVYKGITNNQTFIQGVRAVLALYIVFYAFQFIIGGVDAALKKSDVVMRILKIAIIVQLISPDSWEFFYNNLFRGFLEGVPQIAGMLMSPFQDYDPVQPWYSMDRLLQRLLASQTHAKIWGILFSNASGFLIVIVLIVGFFLFAWALFKAVIVYITAILSMAIVITMAPIFIIFILFDKTKKLWEELLSQIFATSVEILLLLTALGMFAAVIVGFMERNLGYHVCKETVSYVNLFGNPILSTKVWMPNIGNEMASMWVDANGDGIRESSPPETAARYVDIPYFDTVYDDDKITSYKIERNFISFLDGLVFFVAIYLMVNFLSFIPTISNALKGGGSGSADSTSIFAGGGLGGALFDSIKGSVSGGLGWANNLRNYNKTNEYKSLEKRGLKPNRGLFSKTDKQVPDKSGLAENALKGIKNKITQSAAGKAVGTFISNREENLSKQLGALEEKDKTDLTKKLEAHDRLIEKNIKFNLLEKKAKGASGDNSDVDNISDNEAEVKTDEEKNNPNKTAPRKEIGSTTDEANAQQNAFKVDEDSENAGVKAVEERVAKKQELSIKQNYLINKAQQILNNKKFDQATVNELQNFIDTNSNDIDASVLNSLVKQINDLKNNDSGDKTKR